MNKTGLFLCFALFGSCVDKDGKFAVEWNVDSTLPDKGVNQHIGLAGPVVGIIGSELIVGGGANFPDKMPWDGGTKAYESLFYRYDISKEGKLKLKDSIDFNSEIAYGANASDGDYLYVTGGENSAGAVSAVYQYSIKEGGLEKEDLPELPIPLSNASSVCIDQDLYVIGGENKDIVSDKVYVLDLSKKEGAWKEFCQLPKPITHAIVVADQNKNILIAGGRKRNTNAKSDIYNSVYQLNIESKEIKTLANLTEPLAAGTGVYYNGKLIIIGGDNGQTFHVVEQLIADINLEVDAGKKAELVNRKNKIQSQHPGFVKRVWALDLQSQIWTPSDSIPFASPVTTTAILYKNQIIIPSGEIKAGVRTNQILMGAIK